MSNETYDMAEVMKLVQRKFPTCNTIDARNYTENDVATKCERVSRDIIIGQTKKKPGLVASVCTGSHNVYILKVDVNVE